MEKRILTENRLYAFKEHLIYEEKSAATVEKYLRDCRAFFMFSKQKEPSCVVTKELLIAYKSRFTAHIRGGIPISLKNSPFIKKVSHIRYANMTIKMCQYRIYDIFVKTFPMSNTFCS